MHMQYRHLISGEAYGVSHQPGDLVSPRVPKRKLQEWVAAGIIEEVESSEEGENQDEL